METELNKSEAAEYGEVWKNVISIAFRIIVGACVLYFVISLVQWKNVIIAYQSADGRFIIFAALLLFVNIGVRTFKWHAMLRTVKDAPTYTEAFGSVMLGISLGSFTPGEVGEFAGRALHITDAKRSHLVGLTLLDKAQIFIVTSCAGLVSLASLAFDNPLIIAIVTIAIVLLSVFFITRLGVLAALGHRLNSTLFKKSWLTRVLDGFNLLKPQQLFAAVLYTLIFYGVLILQMYCLINSFSKISLLHAFIGTSAMMFVKSLLPISIGDLGIREAGSIFFFSTYSISQAAALNASLLLFLINVFIPSIIGTYFIRHQQLSPFKLVQFWKKKTTSQ
ncbi:MAG: lysylphosphatidylglycerol synthase transmembrane domain-containing protein [Ignavibacteriales bacterium]|nr:lysylphosphatidylglycerol synthase transmembrane domain-containing protein [Ignavibacteriales bacterium]